MVTDHNISSTDSIVKNTWYHVKILLKRFHLIMNGHTIGFHPQAQKLELHTKYIAPESTAEEVSFEWSHNRILSTVSKVRTTLNTACQSTC